MGNSLLSIVNGFSLWWMVYVFIVSVVTQVYWNYSMGGESRDSESPGSRLERQEPQLGKQNAG